MQQGRAQFRILGLQVEEAIPEFDLDAVWQAVIRLRAWQSGSPLLAFYQDPAKRALLKPEAVYEIETGLEQSAYDITAASVVRNDWTQAVRRFFERYDYFIAPTAQVFPFDGGIAEVLALAGKQSGIEFIDPGAADGQRFSALVFWVKQQVELGIRLDGRHP